MKRYTLLIIIALTAFAAHAQITIGGDVYGGGKNGAVNAGNTSATSTTGKTAVTLTKVDSMATNVILSKDAVVRTVFGGGKNGRCYGETNVTMEDGIVGAEKWTNTIHGGIFGAGDGESAWVFGKENKVLIKGGTIYNNVYGGGNQADLMGCTNVTLQDGTYHGSVFGGARMADIYGHSFVNLDGKNVPTGSTLIVPTVYGGNDVAGTITLSDNWAWTSEEGIDTIGIPVHLRYQEKTKDLIDKTWNAFIASTYKDAATNNIFVGNLYSGGNGDYTYTNESVTLKDLYTDKDAYNKEKNTSLTDSEFAALTTEQLKRDTVYTNLAKPTIGKTYLNLVGGTFGYVYGGGNNATVTESADILVWDAHFNYTTYEPYMATIPKSRIADTGMLESMFTITGEGDAAVATPSYQIDRIFGGNNKAEMSIQPHWYLAQGTFNNIYSGGNKGDMTCSTGILVNIGSRSVFANNVYGGCRMADVHPKDDSGNDITSIAEQVLTTFKVLYDKDGSQKGLDNSSYTFAKDYPARVYISEGHINNVYGGNDISGRVYLGSNVAIAGAISGNVYGGGNGSYAYTDNATLGNTTEYGDLYYTPATIKGLNAKRPRVDNTLVHIWGNENQQPKINKTTGAITAVDAYDNATTEQPVIVTGGVYCGGNSAAIESTSDLPSTATFKIGKNVIINAVFLGSNGENMVTESMLKQYAGSVKVNSTDYDYSTLDLTNSETFKTYMNGCAVNIQPTISFDWNAGTDDPHTYIGSLYGGGNVGSMTYGSPITLTMPEGLIIYDQVVGGCNNADVAASSYNAAFEGGVITENNDTSKPKVTINMNSYLEPRQLSPSFNGKFLTSAKLYWDVRKYYQIGDDGTAVSVFKDDDGNAVTVPFILYGANVFGGCYTSGHINGDVTINISHDLISPNIMKNPTYSTSQNFYNMGGYVFAKTMTVYGGGYGENTSIWGNTNVNLSDKARVISVMGGADLGIIGTKKQGFHNAKMGNTIVTCSSNLYDYSKSTAYEGMDKNMPYNAIKVYGGAFAGTIYGHTELRLNGGSFRNVFGGSCKADIADYASLYIGAHDGSGAGIGFPYITGNAYGGNDFGGYIGYDSTGNTSTQLVNNVDDGFEAVSTTINGYNEYYDTQIGYNNQSVCSPRYVEYNSGRIDGDIYGGSCGSYDYKHKFVQWNYLADGKEITATQADASCTNVKYDFDPNDYTSGKVFPYPLAKENIPTESAEIVTNCYVNVRSSSTDKVNDIIKKGILGGGRGIMEQTGIVDAGQTYVYLHSTNWNQRQGNLSYDIYGGGYYSIVDSTKVDAQSGCTSIIYGGSYGTSAANLQKNKLYSIDFSSVKTEVNLYDGMDNSNMAVFGGGGYAGSKDTYVNLYGGMAQNVYGGSYNEGYCQKTHVNVPGEQKDEYDNVTQEASTASVKAIFGGGYGNDVTLPCDEEETNVTFSSATAYVTDGVIYGGNNAKRAAKTTNVTINVPAKTSATGSYISVCGAGNGASTIAGYTNVTLNSGAQVNNIYGGGRDGKVYAYYKNIGTGAQTYYDKDDTYVEDPASDNPRHDYAAWKWTSKETDGNNTKITIYKGATVQNVYGGGYGSDATVAGSTSVYNLGGTVTSNIYGGGYSGNVLYQQAEEKASTTDATVLVTISGDYDDQKNNIYTSIYHYGGTVDNIYGGGYNGNVGSQHDVIKKPADTRVYIGVADKKNYYYGDPIVLRSVYGGGYKGAILGTAKTTMNNGHIGYNFTLGTSTDSIANGLGIYTENLKATADDTNNLLKESGNVFGGGYGEGATTDHTIVTMNDGTIRNSLYGGGEIASVGVADINSINTDDRTQIPNITIAGTTEVNMYGGLVSSNVFGGGRGYAVDAYGNTKTGEVGYSDGYTFGKTNVNIYRGTVGTDSTLVDGAGNVFGGGNIGYVYGADDAISGDKKNVTKGSDSYYHISSDGSGYMSEDSKVLIKPVCKALADGTVNSKSYTKGQIVPHEDLDAITSSTVWTNDVFGDLDKQGVIIRNAVFAGGNVSSGSDKVYANAVTIYGNATASVIDCLAKDLVTIGADDIGGLYGDGNLTFVDGYRELNITDYGTDYYSLNQELDYDAYQKLNERERAYFELKYVCRKAYGSYATGTKISGDEYDKLSDSDKSNWELAGFCTLYAGRMLNTIQRADFCGVKGSRVVLKGAQDRVPSEVDYTKYTINRIGELSLNQVSNNSGGTNGNYFGIYNVVNYLGALTSDVKFSDVRKTSDDSSHKGDETTSYYKFKKDNLTKRYRNDGTSKNEIALASGIWLEVIKQKAESTEDKDVYDLYSYNKGDKIYGPITGVVELDLVNAATGEGGGYVYALNLHGALKSSTAAGQTTLTAANADAVSYKQYSYTTMTADDKMETSGNFISSSNTIIDDCYPNNGAWLPDASPTSTAHYWFIKGDFYVYDQYISAYTGAAQSYSESVNIPLSITADTHGKLRLINIQGNFNAYWTSDQYKNLDSKYKVAGDTTVIVMNGKSYSINSPISYWDYTRLTADERNFFTDSTYVCNVAVKDTYHDKEYTKGQVLTLADYKTAVANLKGKYLVETKITSGLNELYAAGTLLTTDQYNSLTNAQKGQCILATKCFDVTNAISSDNGFLLTCDWGNPKVWEPYYINPTGHTSSDMVTRTKKNSDETTYGDYTLSPTFFYKETQANVYGQKDYEAGVVVSQNEYKSEPTNAATYTTDPQAAFDVAYIAKATCKATWGGTEHYYVKGGAVSKANYDNMSADDQAKFDIGYTCINTYKVSDDKYYVNGDLVTKSEYDTWTDTELKNAFSPAYICTTGGKWGGTLFEAGKNYDALYYCNLDAGDYSHFEYNLDALDVLQAQSVKYDLTNLAYYEPSTSYTSLANYGDRHTNLYAAATSMDYSATYTGSDDLSLSNNVTVKRDGANVTTNTIRTGDKIEREAFENNLANEPANYYKIVVTKDADKDDYYDSTNNCYYFATENFWIGEECYSIGTQVTPTAYGNMSDDNKKKVGCVNSSELRPTEESAWSGDIVNYYYCKNAYPAATAVTTPIVGSAITVGSTVPVGTIISTTDFGTLQNQQKNFELNGSVPQETSSLYVAPSANINSLSQDKIVTVIYEYSYVEAPDEDSSDKDYKTINERHIVNIRVHFETGVPTVGTLIAPTGVLPGNTVGLNQPSVSKGAYEILGGGWEIYTNSTDARDHTNGEVYTNNSTKMYWYQSGYQVAYYAKSYLGKTYSNSVPLTVANYHRMADVMANRGDSDGDGTPDYMYLNEAGKNTAIRNPKVYVKDAADLDSLANFFDKTKGGNTGFESIKNCNRIDFIIDGDIDHTEIDHTESWTSLGDATNCFSGNIHGDGHTISGLDHSLLGSLCGNVYNLGVTGSYTGSGVTDAGDGNAYNCWVVTTGSVTDAIKPIHGGTGSTYNCYYYNNYGTREGTTKKDLSAFLDGEVAYNLNSYYLNRRYHNNATTSGSTSYPYWPVANVGTEGGSPTNAYYPAGFSEAYRYVETRYGNEDFIYADGVIPIEANIRKYSVDGNYYPVYPDDYIFFGQKLNYGLISGSTHSDHPEAVNRITNADDESKNTKLLVSDAATSNRVYRAPAYYKSKNMKSAYFNKQVAFAGTYTPSTGNIYDAATDATDLLYKKMTAVDFTGYNDAYNSEQNAFGNPFLDYEGLTKYTTNGLTQNLLVYADQTNDESSYNVLDAALPEVYPDWGSYSNLAVANSGSVSGHLVDKTTSGFLATRDHFLVDKQFFNCPIGYKFDDSHYMWYQRKPDNCVNSSSIGWEAISLPFTAETVTTQTKGEITHFYGTSTTGHEYWLAGFDGISKTETDAATGKTVAYSTFKYPEADATAEDKYVTNTFLWDYYYSHDDGDDNDVDKDSNKDDYQKLYYKDARTYEDYPLYTAAVPYIIGFPGESYYEFDLSGDFVPANRKNDIDAVPAQTISFMSKSEAEIDRSDDASSVTADSYSFVPNYMDTNLIADSDYKLNSEGSAFRPAEENEKVDPFRPYFKKVSSGAKGLTRASGTIDSIVITGVSLDKGIEDKDELSGELKVYAKKGVIVVESGMTKETHVTIHNVNGILAKAFTIAPGEKIETSVPGNVIYIVNKKKIFVR